MKAWLECDSPQLARVSGDLSFGSVRAVERQGLQFLQQDAVCCTIDFAGVAYSDSAGIALLLAWLRQARAHHKDIRFAGLPDNMLALLKLSDLDAVIPLKFS